MRSLDEVEQIVDSKFRFVLLAARRAEQVIRGAEARVDVASPKLARIAMQELLEQKVNWDYGPSPESAVEGETESAEEGAASSE